MQDRDLFVLGNGPSLRNFNFSKEHNFDTVGLNVAFRFWEKINWLPDYYCCLDKVVVSSQAESIKNLIVNDNKIRLFLLQENILEKFPQISKSPKVIIFDDLADNVIFKNLTTITTGAGAAVLGITLGYKNIYLIGVDINYLEKICESTFIDEKILKITKNPKSNPNYFFDEYQLKGDRYHLPNPKPNLHYNSWVQVSEIANDAGVKIFNCSEISKLNIFEYRSLNEYLEERTINKIDSVKYYYNKINTKKVDKFKHYGINLSDNYIINICNIKRFKKYIIVLYLNKKDMQLQPFRLSVAFNGVTIKWKLNHNTSPFLYYSQRFTSFFNNICEIKIKGLNVKRSIDAALIFYEIQSNELDYIPKLIFDYESYVNEYSDVCEAISADKIKDPYYHYVKYGRHECRKYKLKSL